MRILVGKTFGIGNACLAVPLIKALSTLGKVDVLVGNGPDDEGAFEVLRNLQNSRGCIESIWVDSAMAAPTYDVAVMAIPFDGRWQNGVHFRADRVIDGRKRPDNVERLGFDMWKKHEVEYQMDDARELGYTGPTPDGSFLYLDDLAYSCCIETDPDLVYLGIGYKRDPGGFGLSKHFGNDRLIRLMRRIRELRPSTRFVSTGTLRDMFDTGLPLMKAMGGDPAYVCHVETLRKSFGRLAGCRAYVGNDTGMMHVAASLSMPTGMITPYSDLTVKNPPFCKMSMSYLSRLTEGDPEFIAEHFVDFVWRQ